MSQLSSSNTDSISKTDRATAGPQPDSSTPTGSASGNSVTNAQLALMPANTLKANVTAGNSNPQDFAVSTNSFVGRLGGNVAGLNAGQAGTLIAGAAPFTGNTTIALAKLTPVTGNNGSMTLAFSNGLATFFSYVAPT